MARDYFQRQNLTKGINEALDDDLILISDLDEIPNFESFNNFEIKDNILIFEQKTFFYKLNLFYNDFVWFGTKGIKKKISFHLNGLEILKATNYPKWRLILIFKKNILIYH